MINASILKPSKASCLSALSNTQLITLLSRPQARRFSLYLTTKKMAGIKITDLTALSSAAADDYLCIVDVSDTTQSPAGTTKKIEVNNLFESGTWTPTFSNATQCVSNPILSQAKYSRVGNIVTCTIKGIIDVDFSGGIYDNGSFNFTYPIAITGAANAVGTASLETDNLCNGLVKEQKILFSSSDTSFVENALSFYAIFQYEVN